MHILDLDYVVYNGSLDLAGNGLADVLIRFSAGVQVIAMKILKLMEGNDTRIK